MAAQWCSHDNRAVSARRRRDSLDGSPASSTACSSRSDMPVGSRATGTELMVVDDQGVDGGALPVGILHAYAHIRRAAAYSNGARGVASLNIAGAITAAANHVVDGDLDDQFRADVCHCRSVSEVGAAVDQMLADRASVLLGQTGGSKMTVRPSDVSALQDPSHSFMAAATIATAVEVSRVLLPGAVLFRNAIVEFSRRLDSDAALDVGDPAAASAAAACMKRWARRILLTVDAAQKSTDRPLTVYLGPADSDPSAPALDINSVARYLADSTGLPLQGTGRRRLGDSNTISALFNSVEAVASVIEQTTQQIAFAGKPYFASESARRVGAANAVHTIYSTACQRTAGVCASVLAPRQRRIESGDVVPPVPLHGWAADLLTVTTSLSDAITELRSSVVEPLARRAVAPACRIA